MKKLLFINLILFTLYSCEKQSDYSLTTIYYVPDSLKIEQRKWVIETVRAASQHMTGGDYEDVDNTIKTTVAMSNELFQVSEIGLKKINQNDMYSPIYIKSSEFSKKEKLIFDSLQNN